MTLSYFDVVLLILVFILVVRGALVGFVAEFFSKAAVLLGALGAILFYGKLAPFVAELAGPDIFPEAVAFLALFLAVYLLVKILQRLAGSAMQGETMTALDRALGVFLGLAEGVVAVVVILMIFHAQTWFETERFLSSSLIDRILLPVMDRGPSVISGVLNTMNR